MHSKLFDDSIPDRHSFHMQTIPQLARKKDTFQFRNFTQDQKICTSNSSLRILLPRKEKTSHCMLARNEFSPPLHAASDACNKSFSVLSRDIGRTQRTALHRGRRWRLLSSVGTSKVSISIQIQKQTFWKVMGSTYLEGGGGGANFLAPPSCCDQLAEREKLGGAAE